MSGSSYVNVFGGSPVAPANPSYLSLSFAADTALVWPLETTETTPYVAGLIDVTATTTGLHLAMPPANTGSTGVACIIANVGSNTFTLTDANGTQIAVIPTTQQWIIALINNSTESGGWRAYQLASTTSSASASSLAGLGLIANGPLLETELTTAYEAGDAFISTLFRATNAIFFGSAPATWTFDRPGNLVPGWFMAYVNQGTADVTFIGSGGATFNVNQASFVVKPGQSGFINCYSGGYNTIAGLSAPVSIANGGTGSTNAPAALTALGGTSVGESIFTAPSAAAVVALLGLTNFTFVESTIATPQTLAAGSSNTMFVATTGLTITCPLTRSLTNKWCFGIYAQGGNVTITPQAADSINGQTLGTSLVIHKGVSALIVTDANGFLWPLFLAAVRTGETDYTTAGTFSFTVPAGINQIYAKAVGGGGGGGGAAVTDGSHVCVAAGGNGGARGYGYFAVSPGDVITVTVGAGGTAGTNAGSGSAGTGGTSSFGAFLIAPGGTGAPNGAAVATGSVVQGPALPSSVATGGNINGGEVAGSPGISGAGGSNVLGGTGGQGPYGGGGRGSTNAAGGLAFAPGAGGGGASAAPSAGSGFAGGAGADGGVIVRWLTGT